MNFIIFTFKILSLIHYNFGTEFYFGTISYFFYARNLFAKCLLREMFLRNSVKVFISLYQTIRADTISVLGFLTVGTEMS